MTQPKTPGQAARDEMHRQGAWHYGAWDYEAIAQAAIDAAKASGEVVSREEHSALIERVQVFARYLEQWGPDDEMASEAVKLRHCVFANVDPNGKKT